jgi:4-amino-4-deoxy-L-arabinose transferase-like glycosyltransferase
MIPSIIALLALLLIVARRPIGDASRFALIWSACAIGGSFIPPNFSEHYYLPSVPALAMAIASFGLKRADFARRPIFAAIAVVALIVASWQTVVNAINVRTDSAYIATLGGWIRDSLGSGTTVYTREYFPDIQLAADSRNVGALWRPGEPVPDVIVAGPRLLPEMVETRRSVRWTFGDRSLVYDPVCGDRSGPLIALYVIEGRAGEFQCDDTRNPP